MEPRIALVTGASRGLGYTVADFLAAEGYDLVVTARGRGDLERAAEALRRHGGGVAALAGDVTDPAHRRRLVDAAAASTGEGGRLDLLINNASTLGATPLRALADYPLDELEAAFRVNVVAPLALAREALPLLAAAGGLVVNVTSDAARAGYPGWGGYGMTKAALDLASLTLAHELEGTGVGQAGGAGPIGVVAVDPGDLRTAMHQAAFPGEDISDRPLPEVTLPFWAWLFERPRRAVTGRRYQAQGERWRVNPPEAPETETPEPVQVPA